MVEMECMICGAPITIEDGEGQDHLRGPFPEEPFRDTSATGEADPVKLDPTDRSALHRPTSTSFIKLGDAAAT